MYALSSLPIGMNCVAAGRGIVFRAWPCATHFLLRRTYMKRLAVVVSVLLLAVLMIGCSIDMADTSLSTSENIVSNEEILVEPSEEPVSQEYAEEELSEETSSQHQHVFSDATCTKASVCTVCGKTDGKPREHTYNNGKSTACGVKDPNYTSSEEMVWIPTKGGKKYHKYSSCSNMDGPLHVTISEAVRRGFTACKRCH